MDNMIYEILYKYFNSLAVSGYKNYGNVYKILFLVCIEEFIRNDFYGYLTKDDYNKINRALYCIYGTDCLIPVPNYKTYNMNKLYIGSLSEMAHRITTLENTKVVKTGEGDIEVPDINIVNN